jgi:hypothetical protein
MSAWSWWSFALGVLVGGGTLIALDLWDNYKGRRR